MGVFFFSVFRLVARSGRSEVHWMDGTGTSGCKWVCSEERRVGAVTVVTLWACMTVAAKMALIHPDACVGGWWMEVPDRKSVV